MQAGSLVRASRSGPQVEAVALGLGGMCLGAPEAARAMDRRTEAVLRTRQGHEESGTPADSLSDPDPRALLQPVARHAPPASNHNTQHDPSPAPPAQLHLVTTDQNCVSRDFTDTDATSTGTDRSLGTADPAAWLRCATVAVPPGRFRTWRDLDQGVVLVQAELGAFHQGDYEG